MFYEQLTLEKAKQLKYGDELYELNVGGIGIHWLWRVTGRVRHCKQHPERIEIPIKHGSRMYGLITNYDYDRLYLKVEA